MQFEILSIRRVFGPFLPFTWCLCGLFVGSTALGEPLRWHRPQSPATLEIDDIASGQDEFEYDNDDSGPTTSTLDAPALLNAPVSARPLEWLGRSEVSGQRTITQASGNVPSVASENDELQRAALQRSIDRVQRLVEKPITSVGTSITSQISAPDIPGSDLRASALQPQFPASHVGDSPMFEYVEFNWQAAATCHRPLYFEEINLERHGYSQVGWLQPAVSAAHFFATVPTLPYQAKLHPPCECVFTLGHGRPGSCVPYRRHYWPFCTREGFAESGAMPELMFSAR